MQVSCLARGSDGRNLTVTQLAEKDQVIIVIIVILLLLLPPIIISLLIIITILLIVIITEIPPGRNSQLRS